MKPCITNTYLKRNNKTRKITNDSDIGNHSIAARDTCAIKTY